MTRIGYIGRVPRAPPRLRRAVGSVSTGTLRVDARSTTAFPNLTSIVASNSLELKPGLGAVIATGTLWVNNPAAPSNQKLYAFRNDSLGRLALETMADSGGAASAWVRAIRSGITPVEIRIVQGKLILGGSDATATLDINSDVVRLRTAKTPSSARTAGNQGDVCWDASYVYVCTATNTWKRTALSTWVTADTLSIGGVSLSIGGTEVAITV